MLTKINKCGNVHCYWTLL